MDYIIITTDDIKLKDESITHYNNNLIWNRQASINYFNNARLFFLKEFNLIVSEFHMIQASNCSKEPIYNPKGNFSWERIKVEDGRCSDWVVTDFYPSETYCSCNMIADSGNLTRANSAFRKGLIQTLPVKSLMLVNQSV